MSLPDKLHWTAVTAWHGRRERTLPFWPAARLAALQDRRVRAIVRHAHATVPHYREAMDRLGVRPADIRGAADLVRLPIVTAAELAAAPERFLSSRWRGRDTLELTTTGTTGDFKRIAHDPNSVFAALAAGLRIRAAMAPFVGRQLGYRELVIATPTGTNALVRSYHRAHLLPQLTGRLVPEFVPPSLPMAELVATVNARRPDVISSFGRLLGHVFRHAREHGLPIHRPRLVVYGGDRMPPADQRLIEEHYGIPVWSSYQSCEFLRIAYQCERREGFHVHLDQVAIRVVDDDGGAVPPGGTGQVLVSGLVNRATVLLNYRLGDRVTLGDAPCACGRSLPLLTSIDGRSEDLLLRPDGECVHEAVVLPRLYAVPGLQNVQVVQRSTDRIEATLVVAPGADPQAAMAGLRSALRELLGAGDALRVDVAVAPDIPHEPSGKFKAVISDCRPSPAAAPGAPS
jgi:phenylacetate-CoA ligase